MRCIAIALFSLLLVGVASECYGPCSKDSDCASPCGPCRDKGPQGHVCDVPNENSDNYTLPISTSSPAAQALFDLGKMTTPPCFSAQC